MKRIHVGHAEESAAKLLRSRMIRACRASAFVALGLAMLVASGCVSKVDRAAAGGYFLQEIGFTNDWVAFGLPDCSLAQRPTIAVSPNGLRVFTGPGFQGSEPDRHHLTEILVPADASPSRPMTHVKTVESVVELSPGVLAMRGNDELLVARFVGAMNYFAPTPGGAAFASYAVGSDGALVPRAQLALPNDTTVGPNLVFDDSIVLVEQVLPGPHQWLVLDVPRGTLALDSIRVLSKIPIDGGQGGRQSGGYLATVGGRRFFVFVEGAARQISTWDLTNASSPVSVSRIPIPPPVIDVGTGQSTATGKGDLVAVLADIHNVHLFRITADGSLEFLKSLGVSLRTDTGASDLRMIGDSFFVQSPPGSMTVYSFADPRNPKVVTQEYIQSIYTFDVAPSASLLVERDCKSLGLYRVAH